MPIIPPPSIDDSDTIETSTEMWGDNSVSNYNRIKIYLDCPNWKCPECKSTMFGRCVRCAYCHLKFGKTVNRPE